MRDRIRSSLTEALKARDTLRTATLRLVSAALKDRDIDARGQGKDQISDEEILALLQKMVKQREESAKIYAENGREELAERERGEIAIIEEFLPKELSAAELDKAIGAAVAETGAAGVKDMGRVIAALKAKYPGQIDFGKASGLVRAKLGA
ncbi:MAG: GatB/YqeY domain-containing protein [Hyphomicrobiaceae bacterium]|nr:GatB/YqeY domain-containing protein [Hyphomicrobiaceae bacterium]